MHIFLAQAVHSGLLRPLDLQFAEHMAAFDGENATDELLLAAALVSNRVGEGDVCIDLNQCGKFPLFQVGEEHAALLLPFTVDDWMAVLRRSVVVNVPGGNSPLILDDQGRLYLSRYWHFEQTVADALNDRTRRWIEDIDRDKFQASLKRLFVNKAVTEIDGPDWQRVAAAIAVLRPFCVISGGPGTGKTRTVTSILALLVEQANDARLRIALAAPTGKAAARLNQSIRAAKGELSLTDEIRNAIPEQAQTLHRLLEFRSGRVNPRYGPGERLHLDVLVVDEASMVDLPLMARLLAALPEDARLILLGDKDQLASVEAGKVLGDICGRQAEITYSAASCEVIEPLSGDRLPKASAKLPPIADHIVVLQKSWRFHEKSGIGRLARAVNTENATQALAVLANDAFPDARLVRSTDGMLGGLISELLIPAFRKVIEASDPTAALQALNQLRVLCAVREGPQGVKYLNQRIERALEKAGLIEPVGRIYPGQPVMVTVNDHDQRLYNGDVGLILRDQASNGALRVFFETSDGVRQIPPTRLPPHETVYAMTIHKSQGSEFSRVLMLLPEIQTSLVTKELVYTGITRAKDEVILYCSPDQLTHAINQRIERFTGLYDGLWL